MSRKVYVVGVGMTKFEKPGAGDWDYPDMAREAGSRALEDAGLEYAAIQQAVVGYVYGDSTSGQRAIYELGLTGIPIYNVNNNCSTGSTALFLAKQLVEGGLADCVMALGFEKMAKGSLSSTFSDRINPAQKHFIRMSELHGFAAAPPAAQLFGNAGREHMKQYGTSAEAFAKVAAKNHRHSVNNPYAQFQADFTTDEVLGSRMIHEPLTKLQCCPTSDGAGAAVLCSEAVVEAHGLEDRAIEIAGMAMATDLPGTFEQSCIDVVGFQMSREAATQAFRAAELSAADVDVIELHDCFSVNELLTYEALGLCGLGEGSALIEAGDVTYGGKWVVNPSGGLISKGHPLGATGLAQCTELVWQLRGQAEKRQVEGATVALQHNLGLGGAAVVTIYRGDRRR